MPNFNYYSSSMENDLVEIEDGCWDYYSGLPNPNWYDPTFSSNIEDED